MLEELIGYTSVVYKNTMIPIYFTNIDVRIKDYFDFE